MDGEKVANLLQIPQYFDLDIYTTSRQEKVTHDSKTNRPSVSRKAEIYHSCELFSVGQLVLNSSVRSRI